MKYKIIKRAPSAAILGHIPHSSKYIPDRLRSSFILDDKSLRAELIRMTDAYTDQLFAGIKNTGVLFVNICSRLVMDPERFMDDGKEIMAKRGMGAIYTKTSDGHPLRKPLSQLKRAAILDQYYRPYHDRLTHEVSELTSAFGKCLIIDGHSFPSKPLPYEMNRNARRPEICIGTDTFHTSKALKKQTVRYFKKHGLSVSVNKPFAGSLVPIKFYKKTKRVESIMIEINRKLYMNEKTGCKLPGFRRIKELISKYIEEVITYQREASLV